MKITEDQSKRVVVKTSTMLSNLSMRLEEDRVFVSATTTTTESSSLGEKEVGTGSHTVVLNPDNDIVILDPSNDSPTGKSYSIDKFYTMMYSLYKHVVAQEEAERQEELDKIAAERAEIDAEEEAAVEGSE